MFDLINTFMSQKDTKTLLKKSRILPQTYSTQTKEQNKINFMKKRGISFPSSKRTMLVGLEINAKEDSPENMIKEELLFALEANRIYTIVIGENPHPTHFKNIYFVVALLSDVIDNKAKYTDWFVERANQACDSSFCSHPNFSFALPSLLG